MATTYTLVLMDEYDWSYFGITKDDCKSIVSDCGYYVKASTDYFMIVDCGRTPPEMACKALLYAKFFYDVAYSMRDNDMALVKVTI